MLNSIDVWCFFFLLEKEVFDNNIQHGRDFTNIYRLKSSINVNKIHLAHDDSMFNQITKVKSRWHHAVYMWWTSKPMHFGNWFCEFWSLLSNWKSLASWRQDKNGHIQMMKDWKWTSSRQEVMWLNIRTFSSSLQINFLNCTRTQSFLRKNCCTPDRKNAVINIKINTKAFQNSNQFSAESS